MLPAILGKKIGMTQVYDEQGGLHPVTVVEAGPCHILQVKTTDTDGYHAVQIGFEDVKPSRAKRPEVGHAARAGVKAKKFVRELRLDEATDAQTGQELTVAIFDGVKAVDVTGRTKGKGFQGVMRRWGFKGLPASHGTERKHRSPGSISSHASNAGTGPTIKKGKRMAGHDGFVQATTRNHKLVGVDTDNNLLLIKGSIPGPNGTYVMIRRSKTARVAD